MFSGHCASGSNGGYVALAPAENDEYVAQRFDYPKYYSKCVSAAINVPEAELLVPEGLPVFRVKPQRHSSLLQGGYP